MARTKRAKKALSLLLAFCMVFTLLPAAVFAANDAEPVDELVQQTEENIADTGAILSDGADTVAPEDDNETVSGDASTTDSEDIEEAVSDSPDSADAESDDAETEAPLLDDTEDDEAASPSPATPSDLPEEPQTERRRQRPPNRRLFPKQNTLPLTSPGL